MILADPAFQDEVIGAPLQDLEALNHRTAWLSTARPDQLPPGDFFVWMMLAGRGSGKTRAGAEDIWWSAWKREQRIAVIGPTSNDVRKTCFEGESGLLACIPDALVRNYNRTSLELWLDNGSYFVGYSSEEPERLRGPQHHRAWCDELAAWTHPEETWDMMLFGLRLGDDPTITVTTTPKPIKLIKGLMVDHDTIVRRASTFDNAAHLPKKILAKLKWKYDGTRLGRQELYAEILEDNPHALWQRTLIDRCRVRECPDLVRVLVGVDPPATTGEDADECGVVVAGLGADSHGYILSDASCQGLSPEGWGALSVQQYNAHQADGIVAEVNQGGDMVETVIRTVDAEAHVIKVRASRGKVVRAEPISALYEQGRVHHVGTFGALEDQMCEFTTAFDRARSGFSPDRVDALVWVLTELMLEGEAGDPRVRTL